LILLVLPPLSILAAIYGIASFIEETANRVMEWTEKWGNALANWFEKKRKRQIPSENIKGEARPALPDAECSKQTKNETK
jgi:hypothetical protein